MDRPAAIDGHFADIRTVKTRSTIQMIIELPIERGADIIQMFGFPQPANPVPVAIARLEVVPDNVSPRPHGDKNGASDRHPRAWSDLPLAQQSAIRCGEIAFQRFLREEGDMPTCNTADDAATYVRFICGVGSRREIENSAAAKAKWTDLETRYQLWLQDVAL